MCLCYAILFCVEMMVQANELAGRMNPAPTGRDKSRREDREDLPFLDDFLKVFVVCGCCCGDGG
jgi:hypothetical protein